ncbi:nucleoside triphosphate pyrophosphohydrolase family protein [Moraxella sp. ZY200743]|uniref:nucleoside triphosphate pyrophosphohydrolase family protein n=1 Tax=Moraxella sp. ZY200743 TaxID=2911970 RepID=UPI003D7ECFFA
MKQDINLGDLVNQIVTQTKDLDTIFSIIQWFKIAKPNPSNQDLIKQIAFHCEEFSEMLIAIRCDDIADMVERLKYDLLSISNDADESKEFMDNVDEAELIDALCDQIVTALGVGYMISFDMEGALAEVNRSNYTKFTTDEHGNLVPYITKNGKIGKNPDTYRRPNLEPFMPSDFDE